MSVKGSCILKQPSSSRWVNLFNAWLKSGHVAVVIHCEDNQMIRNVQRSATNYKNRYGEKFWTHTDGNDLYLIRSDAMKRSAVEVKYEKNGVIYFYDSKKSI